MQSVKFIKKAFGVITMILYDVPQICVSHATNTEFTYIENFYA